MCKGYKICSILNEQTGEAWCVGNCIEYHKLQYIKMSDSAHIFGFHHGKIKNKQNAKLKKVK